MRPLQPSVIAGAVLVLCLALLLPLHNPLERLGYTPPSQQTSPTPKAIGKENISASADIQQLSAPASNTASINSASEQIPSPNEYVHSKRGTKERRVSFEEKNGAKEEDEESEEDEEKGEHPGYQEQLLMMLRDPKTGEIPDGIGYREREFLRNLPSRSGKVREQGKEKGTAELQASSIIWQTRGPLNIGGRTRTVAIDVSNENVILAAGVGGGGIWRSTNKGQSWTRTTSTPQAPNATSLVQDKRPGKQNIWYCGTGEFWYSGFPTKMQGILKSTDGGLTWQSLPSTAGLSTLQNVFSVVANTANLLQDEIIAATSGGIIRSVDGGVSWTTAIPTSTSAARTHVTISSTGVLYAVVSDANRRVYRSSDGVSWTDISPPNFQSITQSMQRGVLAVAPSNPNTVYLAFSNPYGSSGIIFMKYGYLSGNGSGAGGAWEDRTSNVINSPVVSLSSGTQGGYDMLLGVYPQNENIVFLGGVSFYRSMDGFQTPSQVSGNTGIHSDHHAITFFSDGRGLAANDGGVYISVGSVLLTGSIQWSSLNSGYINSQFYHIAIDEQTSGSNVVMGGMQDNGTYLTATNGLGAWQGTGGGDGVYSAITKWGTNRMVYSSYQNGNIYSRMILNGAGSLSNYSTSKIDPINATSRFFIHPYFLDPNSDSVMYYPSGKDIWRHDNLYSIPASGYDQIAGWKQFTSIAPGSITTIAAAKGATTRLYVGSPGSVMRIDNARLASPTAVNVSIGKGFPSFGNVQSIAIDPTNADRAIVAFSNYNVQSLFYTTDAGNTWQPVGGNLEQFPDGSGNGPACISAAIVNYQGKTTYFVGTSAGLYSTTTLNGMSTTWMLEDGVQPGIAIMHIAKRDNDGMVAVATHGTGVYSTFLGGAPPVSTVSLTGFVRDNSSPAIPLQGVTVSLSNGLQAVTDASGAYSFTNLAKNVYSVSVTLPNGYYTATKTVLKDLTQQSGTQDFTLSPMQITGKITLNAIGLANVSVSAGAGGTALTNALGVYTINKVNVGSYTVTPTLAGYTFTPTTRTVSLTNVQNPVSPTVYGIASNINFTATPIPLLTVSPQTLTIASAGQSNISIAITSNVAWTANSNQAWASVTPQSGSNNGTVALNVALNPTTAQRSASITISGGGITRTVTITQGAGTATLAAPVATAATNIAGAGGLMNFTANWLAVAGATGYQIDIATDSTFTLLVANNLSVPGLSYTALGWALKPYYYRVRAVNAGSTSPNSNVIVVTPPAAAALTVSLQTLSVSASQITTTATITANVAWTASSNQSWVTLQQTSGSGNGSMTFTVSTNTTTSARTAIITISGGGITRTIAISQSGTVASLTVSPVAFAPSSAGITNFPITVTANVAWTVTSNQAWATVSPASGTNNGTFSLTVAANASTTQRTASITISGGGITQTITITQAGTTVTNTLNTNIFQINAGAVPAVNGAYPVIVTANVAWTASSNQSWVTVSPASGTGDANVTIQVQTNTTTLQRTAVVTFVGGGITKTVTVIQAGVTSALAAPTITFITVLGTTSFQINWQAVAGAVSYQATVALDAQLTQGVINGNTTTTSFTATGLTSNTPYYYRVRAVAADGTFGAWSSTLSYTTPPVAPTALAVTNITASSFTFNWTSVPGATRYDGEISANSTFSPLRAAFGTSVGNPVATNYTMTITNPPLTPGATYYYRVKASVGLSTSSYSNVVSFTVPALALTLKTSPNPSADILRVEVEIAESEIVQNAEAKEPLTVRLMDARGIVLQERTLSGTLSSVNTEFDVHALHPGTYFVEVRSESGKLNLRRTEKFIKQ